MLQTGDTTDTAASERLAELVAEIIERSLGFEPDEYGPEDSFINDLGVDSLSVVHLVESVREQFGIEMSEGEAASLPTPASLVRFIAQRVRPAGETGGQSDGD